MADQGPTIEDILASYGGGTDPVVNTQIPSIPLPAGSVAMQQRGPWMRDYLHPQIADFLASILQYGPMALGSRAGATKAYDAGMAQKLHHQTLMAPEGKYPYDHGVTGGEPDPVAWHNAFSEGRFPKGDYMGSSGELAARSGVKDDVPGAFNQIYSRHTLRLTSPTPPPANDYAPSASAQAPTMDPYTLARMIQQHEAEAALINRYYGEGEGSRVHTADIIRGPWGPAKE